MSRVNLGPLTGFTHSRYTVQLSDGKRIVLFRLPSIESSKKDRSVNETDDGWTYYAMEAECPHAGGPMAHAPVDIEDSSYVVTCPWHAYDFNVETGESTFGITACTFAVTVRSDDNMVILHVPDDEVSLVKLEPVSEQVKFQKKDEVGRLESPSVKDLAALSLETAPPRYLDDESTLCDWCAHILNTSNPEHKIELATHLYATFSEREGSSAPMQLGRGTVIPPAKPPREDMKTVQPYETPKLGRAGTLKSRINMLHALANIEQWAIDLALDICIRFSIFRTQDETSQELPRMFFYDWLKVANDEAKHFSLLRARLEELGSHFGALPVHHGLWESAAATAHDLRARISIIALVHEARGLDVNPMTIERFRKAGDLESVDTLEIIHHDEITHVTTGHRWLSWICQQEKTDPVHVFRSNVQRYFRGPVKGPFNAEARRQAGMDGSYYEDLQGLRDDTVLARG